MKILFKNIWNYTEYKYNKYKNGFQIINMMQRAS